MAHHLVSTPLGEQRKGWHIVRYLALPNCFVLFPNQCGISTIHVLFSSPTNVGHHNPPPSGPSVLSGTSPRVYPLRGTTKRLTHRPVSSSPQLFCSLPQPMWDITIHLPSGPRVLTGILPRVYPLRGTTRKPAHRLPVSSSNTICNSPNPPLDVLFGLFFSSFSSRL